LHVAVPSTESTRGPAAGISSQEGFAPLVEAVTEYAIFLLDRDGRILSWNRGAERAQGFSRFDVVGQPIARLYLPEDAAAGVPAVILRRAAERGNDVSLGGCCAWTARASGPES